MVDDLNMLETGDRDHFKAHIWRTFEGLVKKVVTSSREEVVRAITDLVRLPLTEAEFEKGSYVDQLEVAAEKVYEAGSTVKLLEAERQAALAIAAMVNGGVRVVRSTGDDAESTAELAIAVKNVGDEVEKRSVLCSIGCTEILMYQVKTLCAWAHTKAAGAKESMMGSFGDELEKKVKATTVLLGKLPDPEASVSDFMKLMKVNLGDKGAPG